jgi:hypothetical protein
MKTPHTPLAEFESIFGLGPILLYVGLGLELSPHVSGQHYLFVHGGERDCGLLVRFSNNGRLRAGTWRGYETAAGTDWPLEADHLTPFGVEGYFHEFMQPDPNFRPFPAASKRGGHKKI